MNIAILGTGYVGLVAGVCFADSGHDVIGVDSKVPRFRRFKSGKVPFYEPGLDDLFQLNRKRMKFTVSIAEAVTDAQVIFIAVGTPELPMAPRTWNPLSRRLAEICEAATEEQNHRLQKHGSNRNRAQNRGLLQGKLRL